MVTDRYVGVDVGGSWIKISPVRVSTGELLLDQPIVEPTPRPVTPDAVAEKVRELVHTLDGSDPVGVTLPCVVRRGRCQSASNIDPSWVGRDVGELFCRALGGRDVTVLNDADAAGLAECTFGAGRNESGSVLVLAFGTGLGTALVHGGRLIPNKEYGQCRMPDGRTAEQYVGRSTSLGAGFDWSRWIHRVNDYLAEVVPLVSPDLIVFAGGVAADGLVECWRGDLKHVRGDLPIVPAQFGGYAAVVGAAYAAASRDLVPAARAAG